jgi:hypothetical protein
VRRLAVILPIALLLLAGRAHAACPPDSRIAEWVLGGGLCLAASTFGAENAGERPTLVVVVHGDISDGGLATYHVAFARRLARRGVVAVALTRPGYTVEPRRASAGSTLGKSPRLIDAAVLVSCPCDVARWRRERWRDRWRWSESPSHYVARVPRGTAVVAITGSRDGNTAQRLAEDYVRKLMRRGVDARFVAVQGAGHAFSGVAAATVEAVVEASSLR